MEPTITDNIEIDKNKDMTKQPDEDSITEQVSDLRSPEVAKDHPDWVSE